jgi:hypothetical protein
MYNIVIQDIGTMCSYLYWIKMIVGGEGWGGGDEAFSDGCRISNQANQAHCLEVVKPICR